MLSIFSKKEKNIAPDGSRFSPSKVATISAIQRVESELGFKIPQLLKDLYINTGNGGFGPGYGVMGIPGGFTDDQGSNILSLYRYFLEPYPEDPAWIWPKGTMGSQSKANKQYRYVEKNLRTTLCQSALAANLKDKYRLTDKFSLIASFLSSEPAEDIELFRSMKKIRDTISHGKEFTEETLPVEDARRLSAKYLRDHMLVVGA